MNTCPRCGKSVPYAVIQSIKILYPVTQKEFAGVSLTCPNGNCGTILSISFSPVPQAAARAP